jgi:hypothetical protein
LVENPGEKKLLKCLLDHKNKMALKEMGGFGSDYFASG